MKFSKVIKKHIKKISFRKEINIFINYLDALKQKFELITDIDGLDESIKRTYKKIYLSDKYHDLAKQCSSILNRIKTHNQVVNEINKNIECFNVQLLIDNPLINASNFFKNHDLILQKINGFAIKYDKHIKFINTMHELKQDLNSIQNQFSLINKLKKQIEVIFSSNCYIDGRDEIKIFGLINHCSDKLKQYQKCYYSIDKLWNVEDSVKSHNANYIENNLNNQLFDDVCGRRLAIDQKKAILCDSVSNLVIAGAGSGKTLTICGKAKYLLSKKNMSKSDLLFLSYSNDSSKDLKRKLDMIESDFDVYTFHSLGLKILGSFDNKIKNVEANFDAIIERFFREEMFLPKNKLLLGKIFEFHAKYSSPPEKTTYESKGELYKNLKGCGYKTLKNLLIDFSIDIVKRETINKEHVKSIQEMAIANFYFINGIKYRYEMPFKIDLSTSERRQYNPDFTLIDHEIYHEHFGIDRNSKCMQFSKKEQDRYLEGMEWKNGVHSKYETKYIKTYSYDFDEGIIFEKLEQQLLSFGIKLAPISFNEIKEAMNSIYANRSFKSFIKLVKTFISLYKTKYQDSSFFNILRAKHFDTLYEKHRSILFLDICENIYLYYYEQLLGKIDFDDMILKATDKLKYLSNYKYKHIIVDEFQDISYSRMLLLQSLIKHGNSKLFAVGDDWQSIYRFSGSDLGIFLNFNQYFDFSTQSRLSTNFRNSKELHDIIEPFITANHEQIKKDIICESSLKEPVRIIFYENSKVDAFNIALQEISVLDKQAKILLLIRNNFDLKEFDENSDFKISKDGTFSYLKFPDLKMYVKTVHSSKGLEEDFVIIVNNENSRIGFPNKIEDDPLISLVQSDKTIFKFAEERRLFYVALTRTKNYCYLLVNKNAVSEFVDEIKDRCKLINYGFNEVDEDIIYCPECHAGKLVIRQSGDEFFYGCENYPYCDYKSKNINGIEKAKRCPKCNHFIIWKKSKHGSFLACSNYPCCKFKPEKNEYDYWKYDEN